MLCGYFFFENLWDISASRTDHCNFSPIQSWRASSRSQNWIKSFTIFLCRYFVELGPILKAKKKKKIYLLLPAFEVLKYWYCIILRKTRGKFKVASWGLSASYCVSKHFSSLCLDTTAQRFLCVWIQFALDVLYDHTAQYKCPWTNFLMPQMF